MVVRTAGVPPPAAATGRRAAQQYVRAAAGAGNARRGEMIETALQLENRAGLPEPLRVLLAEYPRTGWAADPRFSGTVQFWLERHTMFRKLLKLMTEESEALLDRRADPRTFGARLARHGGLFVNELHGHHQVEDLHYFPVLARQDGRIARGFEILDHDHHAIDGHLAAFVEAANGVIGRLDDRAALQDRTGAFHADLRRLTGFLERHLTDEEDLVVPVILKYGDRALPY